MHQLSASFSLRWCHLPQGRAWRVSDRQDILQTEVGICQTLGREAGERDEAHDIPRWQNLRSKAVASHGDAPLSLFFISRRHRNYSTIWMSSYFKG